MHEISCREKPVCRPRFDLNSEISGPMMWQTVGNPPSRYPSQHGVFYLATVEVTIMACALYLSYQNLTEDHRHLVLARP
jgi:hypothetical protein